MHRPKQQVWFYICTCIRLCRQEAAAFYFLYKQCNFSKGFTKIVIETKTFKNERNKSFKMLSNQVIFTFVRSYHESRVQTRSEAFLGVRSFRVMRNIIQCCTGFMKFVSECHYPPCRRRSPILTQDGNIGEVCTQAKCHPREGLPYKSDGDDRRNFGKITPKRYQNHVLWVWLELIFTPKRYQF